METQMLVKSAYSCDGNITNSCSAKQSSGGLGRLGTLQPGFLHKCLLGCVGDLVFPPAVTSTDQLKAVACSTCRSIEECCPSCLPAGWAWPWASIPSGRGRAASRAGGGHRGHGSASCPRVPLGMAVPRVHVPLAGGSSWHHPGMPPQLPVDVGMDHQEARPEGGVRLGTGTGTGEAGIAVSVESPVWSCAGASEAKPWGGAGRAQAGAALRTEPCSSSDVLHAWEVREHSGFLSPSK